MNKDETRTLAIKMAEEAQALAGAGEYEGATAYAAVAQAYAVIVQSWGDYDPGVPEQVKPEQVKPVGELPDWCGQCDGPEPGRRVVDVPVPAGQPKLVKWCPRCEPRSAEYQAAHAAQEG